MVSPWISGTGKSEKITITNDKAQKNVDRGCK
jgi:hypothetical protein